MASVKIRHDPLRDEDSWVRTIADIANLTGLPTTDILREVFGVCRVHGVNPFEDERGTHPLRTLTFADLDVTQLAADLQREIDADASIFGLSPLLQG